MSKAKEFMDLYYPRGWEHYYIPRSNLNPHGTYAIVDTREMNIDKTIRRHITEISGFGDGSPGDRNTPTEVRCIKAVPDMIKALIPFAEVAEDYYEDCDPDDLKIDDLGVRDITVGDCRRARDVLNKIFEETD